MIVLRVLVGCAQTAQGLAGGEGCWGEWCRVTVLGIWPLDVGKRFCFNCCFVMTLCRGDLTAGMYWCLVVGIIYVTDIVVVRSECAILVIEKR